MMDHAQKFAELPDEEAARSMGLSLDFAEPQVAMAVKTEERSPRFYEGVKDGDQDRNGDDALMVLPGQLDIRSWLVPERLCEGMEDVATTDHLKEEMPELADEEAARGMGLSLDFAEPQEAMTVEAEELCARALAEMLAAEEQMEEDARIAEARHEALACMIDEQQQVAAALALGLSFGLKDIGAEASGPSPVTPRRRLGAPQKEQSTPPRSKRSRRSDGHCEEEPFPRGKNPRLASKNSNGK